MDDQPHAAHSRNVSHYYGDVVRALFVLSAILIFITESIAEDRLLSPAMTIVTLLAIVLAAGITNPRQRWIHWTNTGIAIVGLLVFGTSALERYRAGVGLTFKDALVSLIALIFLVTLYFATRTLRGLILRTHAAQPD